ncbi:FAD-binding domain-containing protein [Ophiobolus disseminans]|uniref:FAD-binding domain-containing protein n=1 Tax=Ophiobolus disseminans TaxID=1469910 RepID=A0A6A7AIE0_9PLEO|nr:FAD-binding domain-containing protein [Ophiobolus disseminans]
MHFAVFAYTLIGAVVATSPAAAQCKTFPGDKNWPSTADWNNFNKTVGGRLVATVPLGTPCHGATFDSATCENLKSEWQYEKIHYESSSSVMAPFFANQSCDPFQPRERPCELGNYVRYAVDAFGPLDVQRTVAFAAAKNIRLVIRNTGHDYLGRSTGAGSLAVWTHHLKDITHIPTYTDSGYNGPAFKLGAGVQGFDIMAAARDKGLVVVGGECPTVGIAGGYTQGGGHSALSTNFGLSADNVLSWEVVTAGGKLVTADKKKNSDLYWALNGGGGGTFGVAVSMTVKAYKEARVGGASLSFFTTDNQQDVFYDAIQAFHEELPAMVDAGTMVVHYFTTSFFMISPLTAYNKSAKEVQTILAPFVARLDAKGVKYTVSYTEFASYYEHYNKNFGPLPVGNIQVGIAQYGTRLIPRSVVKNIAPTWKAVIEKGVTWIGVGTSVKKAGSSATTSVHPAWRNAIVHATLTLPWDFNAPWSDAIATQNKMTNEIIPLVEAATPGSGSYVNEADFRQPNFQTTFWGANYNQLLNIKRKWDPSNLFYVTVGVGSEAWNIQADGRMCRK